MTGYDGTFPKLFRMLPYRDFLEKTRQNPSAGATRHRLMRLEGTETGPDYGRQLSDTASGRRGHEREEIGGRIRETEPDRGGSHPN